MMILDKKKHLKKWARSSLNNRRCVRSLTESLTTRVHGWGTNLQKYVGDCCIFEQLQESRVFPAQNGLLVARRFGALTEGSAHLRKNLNQVIDYEHELKKPYSGLVKILFA